MASSSSSISPSSSSSSSSGSPQIVFDPEKRVYIFFHSMKARTRFGYWTVSKPSGLEFSYTARAEYDSKKGYHPAQYFPYHFSDELFIRVSIISDEDVQSFHDAVHDKYHLAPLSKPVAEAAKSVAELLENEKSEKSCCSCFK